MKNVETESKYDAPESSQNNSRRTRDFTPGRYDSRENHHNHDSLATFSHTHEKIHENNPFDKQPRETVTTLEEGQSLAAHYHLCPTRSSWDMPTVKVSTLI